MKALLSYVAAMPQRALALLHRSERINVDSAQRRARWNEVIAEHQKPLDPPKGSGKVNLPQA